MLHVTVQKKYCNKELQKYGQNKYYNIPHAIFKNKVLKYV